MAYELPKDPTEMTLDEQIETIEEIIEIAENMDPPCPVSGFLTSMLKLAKTQKAGSGDKLNKGHTLAIHQQIQDMENHAEEHGLDFSNTGVAPKAEIQAEREEEVERLIDYVPVRVTDDAFVFNEDSGLGWTINTNIPPGFYTAEVRFNNDEDAEFPTVVTNVRTRLAGDETDYVQDGEANEQIRVLPLPEEGKSVEYPVVDPTFHVEPHHRAFMGVIFKHAERKPQKVLISGPQGTGKTSMMKQLAAEHNYGYFQMSCGMIEGTSEWFGFRDVQDGEIVYVPSAFIEACQTPNTVIVLDEFNRLHSTLQNSLYNILDDFGSAWLDYVQRYIRVASGVIFAATCNIGAAHTGTFQIDAAMADRFAYHLVMEHLSEKDEIRVLRQKTGIDYDTARGLVRVAGQVRANVSNDDSPIMTHISFRQLEAASTLIKEGMSPRDAAKFTIMPMFSDEGESESERAMVMQIFQGIFVS